MFSKIKSLFRTRHNERLLSRITPSIKCIFDLANRNRELIDFDSNDYLRRNPDVKAVGLDALLHYIMHGSTEGREMRPGFSLSWLAEMNGLNDLSPNDILTHFIHHEGSRSRKRVAFFGYAWNSGWRLDVYMRELVLAIADLGFDVDVYIGNQFTASGTTTGFRSDIERDDWSDFIKYREYDHAISFNNSLVLSETVNALRCKIVSVIVDSVGHLFNHSACEWIEPFKLPVHVAPIYLSLVRDLKNDPRTEALVSFIPAATAVGRSVGEDHKHSINICWIASLVGDHRLDSFMDRLQTVPEAQRMAGQCLAAIASGCGIDNDLATIEAADRLCKYADWDHTYLEMQLQNVITNSVRLAVVEKLAPLGLNLFGNDRWRSLFPFSPALVQSFSDAAHIYQHSELCQLYDCSKISINIPQTQAATGLQYRIYDILASRSLLITKYIENSDIEFIFGRKSPIVTFTDLDDLYEKCQYYLNNESARIERVLLCNALVTQSFSFRERAIEYLKLSSDFNEREDKIVRKGFCNLMSVEQVRYFGSKRRTSRG
jgi:spore maturation protein CgeB